MKKILAIALAVVMVLSMASAFAFDWASWTCPTSTPKTGKATVEVIPYVKVNNGCGGFDWVQSNCAAAVKTTEVYFIVKLTVPADVNPVWYKHCGHLKISGTKGGFFGKDETLKAEFDLPDLTAKVDDEKDGWVFYAVADTTARALDDCFEVATPTSFVWADSTADFSADNSSKKTVPDAVMNVVNVYNASKAKLCATFTSNFNGIGEWLTFGDFAIYVDSTDPVGTQEAKRTPTSITIIPSCCTLPAAAKATLNPSNLDSDLDAGKNAAGTSKTAIFDVDAASGKITGAKVGAFGSCDEAFASKARAFFGIDLDTCINADNVRANFGWKDKVESCFTWSGNATAIVDVQCEVEIPKTGDVSVIAYAVMAVVAAAGAMGLKK